MWTAYFLGELTVLHVLAGDRYIGQGVGGREEWVAADEEEATTWRSELSQTVGKSCWHA